MHLTRTRRAQWFFYCAGCFSFESRSNRDQTRGASGDFAPTPYLLVVYLVFGLFSMRPAFSGLTQADYQQVADAFYQDGRAIYLSKSQVGEMLRKHQYRALDRKLALWHRQYLNGKLLEYTIIQSFESFKTNDEADQVYFDQWIKEYPQSYIAYSARGRFHYGLAWQARGQKFIQDTPEANINKSRVLFAKAEADCRQALKLNPNLLSAHYDLMGILMHGARDKEMRTVWKNAVSSNRKSYYLHQRFMTSLQPRWGGSYKKMASYAAMVTKKFTENPRNASLPGFLYRDFEDGS